MAISGNLAARLRRSVPLLLLCARFLPGSLTAQVRGFDPQFMDTTCAPCRDFYRYANGAWLDSASFPADYNTIGVRRDMEDRVTNAVRAILEDAARTTAPVDPDTRLLGAFYNACMDSARADRAGASAIEEELGRISRLRSRAELTPALLRLHRAGIFAPFAFMAAPDPRLSTRHIGLIYQAGLGLPDRDYYLREDTESDTLRRDYEQHIGRTFRLLGWSRAQADRAARRVMVFETALAQASMTLVAQRDPDSVTHVMTVRDLEALAPSVDWSSYFSGLGITTLASSSDSLDVAQPAFLAAVSRLLAEEPLAGWRSYLIWQLVGAMSPYLGSAFFSEQFEFEQRFSGVATPLPRWRRCAEQTDGFLGDALGRAYLARRLAPDAKARVGVMVEHLRAAFRARLAGLTWMGDSTRSEALRKLDGIHAHIASPDRWEEVGPLAIRRDAPHGTNMLAAARAATRRQLAMIGRPVDRDEWQLSTMVVDAYYDATVNGVFLLPGMLQAPRWVSAEDDAVNYGSLGTLIGHELTHGFDDQGRRYDADGNLRDWWTADDAARFEAQAQRVVEQYAAYVAIDTLHVNGELTLGENIADLGGVMVAYDAFQQTLAGRPPTGSIDGFTPEQRFFLGYAQGWRRLYRPETMRFRTLTDPHSPPSLRINGSLANVPAFARAFGCKAGDPMVRDRTALISIW